MAKATKDAVIPLNRIKTFKVFLDKEFPSYSAEVGKCCNLHNILIRSERINENEWEVLSFASNASKYNFFELALNNRCLLDKFAIYFREKAAKLIYKSSFEPLIYNYPAAFVNKNNFYKPYLDAVTTKHMYLENLANKKIKIPHSEMDCLNLLAKGRTAKETAQILNISHRTVETNLNRSKIRLTCYSHKQLLDILEKN